MGRAAEGHGARSWTGCGRRRRSPAAARRFSLSTRPILAATEGAAWDRAQRHPRPGAAHSAAARRRRQRQNVGSQRLLQAAAEAEVHDTCLWTPLAAATGAPGNSTALVGTPETVAKALLEYYKLGATSLLIRGYDPRPDAVQYGEELIPRIRALVAEYDAASGANRRTPQKPARFQRVALGDQLPAAPVFSSAALGSRINPAVHGDGLLHEFAAAVAATDLLLTVDTMAAHCAGALGHPVWLMTPYSPHRCWGTVRGYVGGVPVSFRLFRQKARRGWSSVVAEIAQRAEGWPRGGAPHR